MSNKSFVEKVEDTVSDIFESTSEAVDEMFPDDIILKSVLDASFAALTPQQKLDMMNQTDPEFFIKLATKIEKRLANL